VLEHRACPNQSRLLRRQPWLELTLYALSFGRNSRAHAFALKTSVRAINQSDTRREVSNELLEDFSHWEIVSNQASSL